MFTKTVVLFSFLSLVSSQAALADCKQFIELHSAATVAAELGQSESWVVQNYKINIWKKTTAEGRLPAVGKLLPGSRTLLLEMAGPDFKVKSPFDNSIGWVGQDQVKAMIMQDDKTFKPCE